MIHKIVTIFRQRPYILAEYVGTIANAATYTSTAVPTVGWKEIVGMLYADQTLTLTVEQGINENTGTHLYRYINTWVVPASTPQPVLVLRCARFARIQAANASGALANAELHFELRGL